MGRWLKRLIILPPILLGAAVLAYMVSNRLPPERLPPNEMARPVRTITVPDLAVLPRALGHGPVLPGKVWEGVAQVAGRIVEIHPDLERGAFLSADTVVLRIDPSDYELALTQAHSRIAALEAELVEIGQREANAADSLAIEQRGLELATDDLERKQRLLARGNVSQASLDEAERSLLSNRQLVQQHTNSLTLIPTERQRIRAEIAQLESERARAELDLERTTIRLPFDAHIGLVHVEREQFASRGEVLVEADGMAQAEITAQLPIGQLRRLIVMPDDGIDTDPGNFEQIVTRIGMTAVVRLVSGDFEATWPARVARINDSIDPKTRTVGVIVVVDEPFASAVPGVRPPLVRNMFVDVELRSRERPAQPVVPRSAVHAGVVYVLTDQSRLERREVAIAFTQGDIMAIAANLAAGERIVISDLLPAVEGMLLEPFDDPEALIALTRDADGG